VSVKHKLLDTPPEKVPPDYAQAVIDFAKPIQAITEAYVGLTEISETFHGSHEQLAAAFVVAPEDVDTVQFVADAFSTSAPPDVQAGGCNVLDGAGIAVWRAQAQQVFKR